MIGRHPLTYLWSLLGFGIMITFICGQVRGTWVVGIEVVKEVDGVISLRNALPNLDFCISLINR